MKITLVTLAVFSAMALVVFGALPQTFFQQDEWAIIGNFLYWQKANVNWFNRLFVYEQDTHMIPLGILFSYAQFALFGLKFAPYALISIVMHIANAMLVFALASQMFRSKKISLLAGLLFLINATTHQAVTWTATSAGTLGSTFFALISLNFFYQYIARGKPISRSLIIALTSFIISLGFKETSIFLFVFYPIFWLLWIKKRTVKSLMTLFMILGIVGFLYSGGRVLISQFWSTTASTSAELSQPQITTYVYRLLTNPIKIFTHTIVPIPILLKISRQIVLLGYPQFTVQGVADPYIVETVTADMVSFSFASIAAIALLIFNKNKRFVLLSIAFVGLSALPFLIIPGRAGYINLFDGRHLYFTSVFVAMLMSEIFAKIFRFFAKQRVVIFVLTLLLIGFFSIHAITIRRDIAQQIDVGKLRQSILNIITTAYPRLTEKTIFYIESDKAYYGLPVGENIIPFQSGFGQTLLVWYNARGENFPACFFDRKFLYVLTSQEYKECEGRGFGYFRDPVKLKSVVDEYGIKPEYIHVFRFNSSLNVFSKITNEIYETKSTGIN